MIQKMISCSLLLVSLLTLVPKCMTFSPLLRSHVQAGAFAGSSYSTSRVDRFEPLCAKKKRRRRPPPQEKKPVAEAEPEEEEYVEPVAPPVVKAPVETVAKVEAPKKQPAPMNEPVSLKMAKPMEKKEEELTGMQNVIPVPSMSEDVLKQQLEADLAKIKPKDVNSDEYDMPKAPRIDRNDKKAFMRLLEQQPYSDSDASLFEVEEYTIVNALLGERAKSFLAIPQGPLQVGHFTLALVIVLMAFVQYPGFPLTNLPTPLREALQGGLATVYIVNIVLAVLSVFKSKERGQPVLLWVAKCFSVGGLAYDQLSQIPTVEEVEAAKKLKGKKSSKNRK